MGAGLQIGGALSSRRARRRSARPMSEINVTPMVDVMLVLLIIFMVTAPMLTVGVPIDLPKTAAQPLTGKEPLTVSLDPDGKVFIQDTEIPLDQLAPKLVAITNSGYNEIVFVRADRRTNYGQVMRVLGKIKAAGFQQAKLVADIQEN
jgi:biopolymer transport protein TolR